MIGSAADDIAQTLMQIHRREINVATSLRPQDPAIEHYLRGLDIEWRYMRPTPDNPHPCYGVEPAFFIYDARTNELKFEEKDVPRGDGRDQFLNHIETSARIFSTVTELGEVSVMWRVYGRGE